MQRPDRAMRPVSLARRSRWRRAPLLRWLAVLLAAGLAPAPTSAGPARIAVAVLSRTREPLPPVSPLDREVRDEGAAGARLGMADNNTTGRFTGQTFDLVERVIGPGEDAAEGIRALAADGIRIVVSDLDGPDLIAAASAADARDLLILNSRAPDDALRAEDCRPNVLHTIPNRAMLADALAQYLVAKRWRRWFLVTGRRPGDKLYAQALRRAAKRFGAEIAVEKDWTFQPGNARTDTGHVTLQSEIPAFTQVTDYDVLVVADEADEFGDYLPDRTARPRPVVGTQGLVAAGWSPVSEQWGATQLQARFEKRAGRRMGPVDYAAWVAARAIGEAAVRSKSSDPAVIAAYLRSPEFSLAGFKGQGQSFRDWDGQMRQPILISGARMLVSVSPQAGFLHRGSELDTLGFDREESQCRF